MEFDENEAVKYMRSHVPAELSAMYKDDDELLNLIDLIYDYYEANGMLDLDLDDADDELDVDDMQSYITRMLKKDKGAKLLPEHVPAFVNAYMDYEDSLDE